MQFRSPAMINGFLRECRNLLLLLQCAHFSQSPSYYAASCNSSIILAWLWPNWKVVQARKGNRLVVDIITTPAFCCIAVSLSKLGFRPFPMSSPSIRVVPVTPSSNEAEGLVHCGFRRWEYIEAYVKSRSLHRSLT